MNRAALMVACAAALVGCATSTGVVPMGSNLYMVSREGAAGFDGIGELKAGALAEASAHCGDGDIVLESTTESRPPYILGNFPRVEIQFSCTE